MQDLASSMPDGHLDLVVDPKTAWALANRGHFPVDVNTAARHELLRVPGLGVRSVTRIVSSRRHRRLRFADLKVLGASLRRARFFIVTADYKPQRDERASEHVRTDLLQAGLQGALF